jgi:hypothetical protein
MTKVPGVLARRLALPLVLSAITTVTACSSKSSTTQDSGTASTPTASPSAPPSGSPVMTASPTLPGYPPTANAQDVKAFIEALDFDFKYPKDLKRIAFTEAECETSTCNGPVSFMIVPEKHARQVDWERVISTMGAPGHVVAVYHLVDEVDPGFPDLDTTKPIYHWVGQIDANGARGTAVLTVDPTTWVVTLSRGSRNASACDLPNDAQKESQVKRKKDHPANTVCKDIANTSPQQSRPAARMPWLVPATTWISCKSGCCESLPM